MPHHDWHQISVVAQASCQVLHSLQLYLQEAEAGIAQEQPGPKWQNPPVADPVLQTPAAVDALLNKCMSNAEREVLS